MRPLLLPVPVSADTLSLLLSIADMCTVYIAVPCEHKRRATNAGLQNCRRKMHVGRVRELVLADD
jgi:hypothetical protein